MQKDFLDVFLPVWNFLDSKLEFGVYTFKYMQNSVINLN